MIDCHSLIRKFQFDYVALTDAQKSDMARKRDLNLDRAQSGLKAKGKPEIVDTINQGGKAMDTMTHPPEGDEASRYDIDMGVVFEESDAVGARTTRGWIATAIEQASPANMINTPDLKNKCVRVVYSDGYQCDFPVFKRIPNGDGYRYEVSIGNDWVASDPSAVNLWFRDQVKELSPEANGDYQLRRIVRLMKYFTKVRAQKTDTKFPAGLLVTALVVNNYDPVADRDDQAFYQTLMAIRDSLRWNKQVYVDSVLITDEKDDVRLDRFVEAADKVMRDLEPLIAHNGDLTAEKAAKTWKKVFSHSFFNTANAFNLVSLEEEPSPIETKSASSGLAAVLDLGVGVAAAAIAASAARAAPRDEGFEPRKPVNKAGGGTSG